MDEKQLERLLTELDKLTYEVQQLRLALSKTLSPSPSQADDKHIEGFAAPPSGPGRDGE